MIGDYYGVRVVPHRLYEAVYDDIIAHHDSEAGESVQAALLKWYRRDDNFVPPVMTLREIAEVLPAYAEVDNIDGMEHAYRTLKTDFGTIRTAFRSASVGKPYHAAVSASLLEACFVAAVVRS